jgi:nitroreductase
LINFIKKNIPKQIKWLIKSILKYQLLKKEYKKDMKKYSKHSFEYSRIKTKRHYEADLVFFYHKIEKGLSLPNPRLGFGKKNVYHLLSILENYIKQYGWDDVSSVALNTLYSYYYFNEKNNLKINDLLKRLEELKNLLEDGAKILVGGVDEVTKVEIDKSNVNFKEFAYSRHSIRNYAQGDVSVDLIKEAVNIAQKTPSVCNRQSSRVYVYSDNEWKSEILKYQNGNAGFGESASKILIVTSELKDFRGANERNQSYIDGGMYSMSLIYALHSLGVGTCPLNLTITHKTEVKLKKVANISDSEVLLMMIAVGNLPEKLRVASSPRRLAEEVMTVF